MNQDEQKSARGRPRTLDKNEVLDVAMNAYWQGNPTEISLNSICKMANVSKPSIYREFQSEDGLTHATLEYYTHVVLEKLKSIIEGEGSFKNKIDQMVHTFVEDEAHRNGCLFVKMRAVKSHMGSKTQMLIDALDQSVLEGFAGLLRQARQSGEWKGPISVELGARYLHAQFGLALDQRARGQDPQDTLAIAISALNC